MEWTAYVGAIGGLIGALGGLLSLLGVAYMFGVYGERINTNYRDIESARRLLDDFKKENRAEMDSIRSIHRTDTDALFELLREMTQQELRRLRE